MQPAESPSGSGTDYARGNLGVRNMPRNMLLGLGLAGIGVAFTAILYAWDSLGIRLLNPSGFADYFVLQFGLSLVGFISLQVGLFLLLRGILHLLPISHPWSRIGPLLILGGALVVVAFGITEVVIESSGFSASAGSTLELLFLGLSVVNLAGYLATTLGLVISVLAIAKGVLLRHPAASGLPQP